MIVSLHRRRRPGPDQSVFRRARSDDVDGDGKNEFVDAWGNPIRFLRWPMPVLSTLSPATPPGATSRTCRRPTGRQPRSVRSPRSRYPRNLGDLSLSSIRPDRTRYDIYTGTGSSDDPYAGIDQTRCNPPGTTGTQIGAPGCVQCGGRPRQRQTQPPRQHPQPPSRRESPLKGPAVAGRDWCAGRQETNWETHQSAATVSRAASRLQRQVSAAAGFACLPARVTGLAAGGGNCDLPADRRSGPCGR